MCCLKMHNQKKTIYTIREIVSTKNLFETKLNSGPNKTKLKPNATHFETKLNSYSWSYIEILMNVFIQLQKKQWLNWREFNCLTLPSISYQITEKFSNQTTNKSFDWHKFSPESLTKFSKLFYYMYVKKLVQEVLTILSLKACLLNEKP